ncbi:hypothetical protein B9Z55_011361 [Caenorhabditis nigoni]|uniref:7TM GPCR serpentine receptor class x (Srx) domain-containing protein n=1 Tax=Caenorhabditis nigoni TaxID=1611254 RepID=A0A2G5UJT4_9PELO|nr:hypothetical protein B9Z55_011361 [Caenorhabditis nigoni]
MLTCIFEDSFLESSRFLAYALHTLTSIEMPLHIFGAYLIITKTPRNMKTAKYSILQLHLACTVMDLTITSLWIFYSWIPSSSGYAVGLMSNIGVNPLFQSFLAFNTMSVYNNFLMIAIGCNGLLTTLVMILVHRPYRMSVLEMCGIGTKAEQLSIQAVTLWKMKALGRVSGE